MKDAAACNVRRRNIWTPALPAPLTQKSQAGEPGLEVHPLFNQYCCREPT